jgi:hypothetical protein
MKNSEYSISRTICETGTSVIWSRITFHSAMTAGEAGCGRRGKPLCILTYRN